VPSYRNFFFFFFFEKSNGFPEINLIQYTSLALDHLSKIMSFYVLEVRKARSITVSDKVFPFVTYPCIKIPIMLKLIFTNLLL
jgi:hypothetical protein